MNERFTDEVSFIDQTGCPLAGLRRAQPNRGRRSYKTSMNVECRLTNDGIASHSFFIKIDRTPYFDIRHSLFDIRFFKVSFRLDRPFFEPAAALIDETFDI